jgi:hypothetical protein
MRTFTFPITLLAGAALPCLGQQPVTMIDYAPASSAATINQGIQTNTADIKAALDQLLDKAQKQLAELEKQSVAMGNYKAENRDSVINASNALSAPPVKIKTNEELVKERKETEGSDVFVDSADGTFQGIGNKFTTKEKNDKGKYVEVTKDRDKTFYAEDAKKLYNVNEFYRVRGETTDQRQLLEAARLDVLLALLNTEDNVETQRLTAQLNTINSQLLALGQDVSNASDELTVNEKAMELQRQIDGKAKVEAAGGNTMRSDSAIAAMQAKVDALIKTMKDGAASRAAANNGDGNKDTKTNARGRIHDKTP